MRARKTSLDNLMVGYRQLSCRMLALDSAWKDLVSAVSVKTTTGCSIRESGPGRQGLLTGAVATAQVVVPITLLIW